MPRDHGYHDRTVSVVLSRAGLELLGPACCSAHLGAGGSEGTQEADDHLSHGTSNARCNFLTHNMDLAGSLHGAGHL